MCLLYMKMTGHSSKYLLAYSLADQLDAARKYTKEEIEQFIASKVDLETATEGITGSLNCSSNP